MTLVNRFWLQHHDVPPLYESGVRYQRDAREAFDTLPHVLERGFGDCEDLATWRAAEIPDARAVPVPVSTGWHVVVQLPDGSIEDPSAALGMLDEQ